MVNKSIYPLLDAYYVKKDNKEKIKLKDDLIETNIVFFYNKPLNDMSYMFYELAA